jgi:hypothetical protein
MESDHDLEQNSTNPNKYILQMAKKFKIFILRSPLVKFYIDISDLDQESLTKIKSFVKESKTPEDAYTKLDYIFTEVIQLIALQARPLILSQQASGDGDDGTTIDKMLFNRIREFVSGKWVLVNELGVLIK